MNVESVLPRDAIPSVDDPAFGFDYFGDSDDLVVVVESDPPRAYPVRILSYHEIVNDVVRFSGPDGPAERPVAVTWCPICGSAVVFDRTVDGRELTFDVSGKLADDALVMYDRETESEWRQPSGEAIAGEFAGRRLDALPAPLLAWERFREAHPDGEVLQPVRDGPGEPADAYDMTRYERYFGGDQFGLYGIRGEGEPRQWDRDDLDPKTVVLGVVRGDAAVGYPEPRVRAAGDVVTDAVDDLSVVVVRSDGELHAFENPGYDFEPVAGTDGRVRADGTTWDGATGESADGRRLDRVPARRLFAFAWQDGHGPDAFWSG